MPLNYHSTAGADMDALQQMGGTANSIAFALPQLQMQAARLRQQLALQRATEILRQAQTSEAGAKTGLYEAQTQQAQQKASQGQMLQQGAQQGGQAATLAGMFQNPDLNNPIVRQAIMNAQQSGMLPAEGFQGSRDSIVQALQSLTRGNATQSVLTSPSASEKYLQPPKDIDIAPGHIVYPQGNLQAQPVEGRVNLGQGQESFMPGQQGPEFTGAQKPEGAQKLGNLATEAYKFLPLSERRRMAPGILGQAGITNAPVMPQPQKIKVRHPSGQIGLIPAEQLQQALKEGYQQVQ